MIGNEPYRYIGPFNGRFYVVFPGGYLARWEPDLEEWLEVEDTEWTQLPAPVMNAVQMAIWIFNQEGLFEAGGSGYSAAFTHPDPIDPNDELRQRTQARSKDYPYDTQVSYGRATSTDAGGASYQLAPGHDGPPTPRNKRPEDELPQNVWTQLESLLDPYENGPQADDAAGLGYGSHGRMGEDGMAPDELDLDALRQDFRTCFLDTLPRAQRLGRRDLFGLLVRVDPEYSAELFAPEDDSEMMDLYTGWARHVYAPDAEFDSGTEIDVGDDEQ